MEKDNLNIIERFKRRSIENKIKNNKLNEYDILQFALTAMAENEKPVITSNEYNNFKNIFISKLQEVTQSPVNIQPTENDPTTFNNHLFNLGEKDFSISILRSSSKRKLRKNMDIMPPAIVSCLSNEDVVESLTIPQEHYPYILSTIEQNISSFEKILMNCKDITSNMYSLEPDGTLTPSMENAHYALSYYGNALYQLGDAEEYIKEEIKKTNKEIEIDTPSYEI